MKEAERRQKREQRMLERQQKMQEERPHNNSSEQEQQQPDGVRGGSGRILESIEDQENKLRAAAAEKRAAKKDAMRYITLKPMLKKDHRKKPSAKNVFESVEPEVDHAIDPEPEVDDDLEDQEEEEEFVKRSAVPLPDPSTLKSILHQYGTDPILDKKKKEKKGRRSDVHYADGVIPGEGSPDNTHPRHESPPLTQSEK